MTISLPSPVKGRDPNSLPQFAAPPRRAALRGRGPVGTATAPSRPVLALVALMFLSAAISGFLLIHQSLRLDEAQSLWQTSHGFGRMYQLVAQDVHVPLYHTILRLFTLVFGNGVTSSRVLSMSFFLLTIPATYLLARRAFEVPAALFGAGLLALSPFMNWYGNEIRMYSLLALLVVLNQLFFVRLFQRAAGANWIWYAITACAGIYTHYFFWLTLVTQAVFFMLNRRRFAPGTLGRLAGVALLLVVAITPWLVFVSLQGGAGGDSPLLVPPTSVDLFNTFSQFLFGFQNDAINTLLVALWPLVVLLALLALQKTKRLPAVVGYFLMMGLFPVAVAFAVSVTVRPLYISRYLIIALPSLLLFLTWLFSAYGRRAGRTLRVVFVLGMLGLSLHQAISATTPTKEDYRAASSLLAGEAGPQDIVVLSPPFTSYPFEYYWTGPAALTTLPNWNRFGAGAAPAFDPRTLPQQVAQLKSGHQSAWLVLSYDQGYEKTLVRYFDTHFQRLQTRSLSPGLIAIHYRLRYDVPNTAALLRSLNQRRG